MSQAAAKGKPSRWVLTALTLTHVAQHFYYAGVPILFQGIKADLILSYTDLGIMTGAANVIGGFFQFAYSIAARLLPKRVLLGCANLAIGLGCPIICLADRFAGLLLGNIVAGVGQAGQHPMGASIIARKFGRERVARAMSIF